MMDAMERRISASGVVFYVSPKLERAGVRHAFSTRIGGVSQGVFDSLNLGNPSGCEQQDDVHRIERNYERLYEAIGFTGDERCRVHQVHGARVVRVRCGERFESGQKADAIVSDDPARIAAVRTADCVPVLVAAGDGAVVAAIHAGWRGVIGGIVPETIKRMREGKAGSDLVAAIGPSIGFDAFEVGPEVLDAFAAAFGPDAPIRRRDDQKGHVDLRQSIRLQLRGCGIADERIDVSDRCTFRDAQEFFSHRRERGVTGRMAAIIAPSAR